MQLNYQSQNSTQTLGEAIEEYQGYLTSMGRNVLSDDISDDDSIWLYHDATHAIFGQNTTLEDETALDFWVLFGASFSWKLLRKYQQVPEIENLTKALTLKMGITFLPKLYWRNKKVIWTVIQHSRRMKKKWPLKLPPELLSKTLKELREEYGITVLNEKQKTPTRVTEFDYSVVSNMT